MNAIVQPPARSLWREVCRCRDLSGSINPFSGTLQNGKVTAPVAMLQLEVAFQGLSVVEWRFKDIVSKISILWGLSCSCNLREGTTIFKGTLKLARPTLVSWAKQEEKYPECSLRSPLLQTHFIVCYKFGAFSSFSCSFQERVISATSTRISLALGEIGSGTTLVFASFQARRRQVANQQDMTLRNVPAMFLCLPFKFLWCFPRLVPNPTSLSGKSQAGAPKEEVCQLQCQGRRRSPTTMPASDDI